MSLRRQFAHFGRPRTLQDKISISAGLRAWHGRVRKSLAARETAR